MSNCGQKRKVSVAAEIAGKRSVRRVFVANEGFNSVSAIDTSSNTAVATVTVGDTSSDSP